MRSHIIDFIRGFAFIFMMIHHMYYFNPNSKNLPDFVEYSGIFSRTTFIVLVGITLRLFNNEKNEKNNNKYSKEFYIFLNCILITLTSYIFLPNDNIIFFGVLHFITFSIYFMKDISKSLVLSTIVLLICSIINEYMKNLPPSDNIIHIILGGYSLTRQPIDIFCIPKWLPFVIYGIYLGDLIKKKDLQYILPENIFTEPIEFIGRNSLYLYTAHVIPGIIWMSTKFN
tara:strand:- start:529 stop:1212 length:684 start_codon:yes stop_codon:yes gene_type:complete